MTSRRLDVLAFLARRAGQVLSKGKILAEVWELDSRTMLIAAGVGVLALVGGGTAIAVAGDIGHTPSPP